MLRVTHFFHVLHMSSSRSILRSNRSYIRVPLCVCARNWPPNSQQSQFAYRASSYIYIYPRSLIFGSSPPRSCRIPSLSSYTIATKTVHSSIVNIIIILSFFFFIYTFFIIQTRFYLLFIYNLHAISRRARSGEFEFGGRTPTTTLSIYLSSFDSRFRLHFSVAFSNEKKKRNGERTASARDFRRNGFARVFH